METRYKALLTKTFADGQALADMVQGRTYLADRENEYFIGEFGDAIYLPKEKFDEHFKIVKQKSYQRKAKRDYIKQSTHDGRNKTFLVTLFGDKDRDIIEHLESMKETDEEKKASKGGRGGRTEYIRRLIREDIERCKK